MRKLIYLRAVLGSTNPRRLLSFAFFSGVFWCFHACPLGYRGQLTVRALHVADGSLGRVNISRIRKRVYTFWIFAGILPTRVWSTYLPGYGLLSYPGMNQM